MKKPEPGAVRKHLPGQAKERDVEVSAWNSSSEVQVSAVVSMARSLQEPADV